MMATATNTSGTVTLPTLTVITIEAVIEGITPLITHRFSERVQKAIEDAQQQAGKTKKPPRDPQMEFEESQYRLPDGGYGFPAIGVKRAMVTASGRFADEKMTEMYGAFSIPAEMLVLDTEPPTMRTDRVKIGQNMTSLAYRPEFWPWRATVPIRFNAEFISLEKIVTILKLAGFGVGIGDWRVEKKGTFGQWDVSSVRQIV